MKTPLPGINHGSPLKMHNGVPHWKSNPKFRRDGTLKKVVTRNNKKCKDCEPYKSVIRFDKSGHIKSARNSETKNRYRFYETTL